MQFPNPFKKNPDDERREAERIEPQIGDDKPAPWAVEPESAPAFEPADEADWREEGKAPDVAAEVTPAQKDAPPADEAVPEVPPSIPAETPPTLDAPGTAPQPEAPRAPAAAERAAQKSRAAASPAAKPGFWKKPESRPEEDVVPPAEVLRAREKTRNRLVGAAALLMAVVVAAPFLLDSEEEVKTPAVSTEIPAVPEKTVTTLDPVSPAGSSGDVDVTPSSVEKNDSTAKANLANEAKQQTDVKKEVPKAQEKAPVKKAQEKPVEKPAKQAAKPSSEAKGWYVQVIVTSSERKAEKLVKDLAAQGFPAYRSAFQNKAAQMWRVRVGVYATAEEARGVQGQLALAGQTGKLIVGKQ